MQDGFLDYSQLHLGFVLLIVFYVIKDTYVKLVQVDITKFQMVLVPKVIVLHIPF